MLFSQPLDKKYTKTPNVFFEEVLCAKGTTFNEAKLMGYLIRNTLGYNHKATWIHVSRSKLLQNAHISCGSINPTIHSCIKKGWILEVKQGDKGREQRYLFLRTPRNEQIVQGLTEGRIQLSDLGANATSVLGAESEQAKRSYTGNETVSSAKSEQGYSNFEQVTYSPAEQGCSKLGKVPCTESEEAPYSNSIHVDKLSSHIYQGFVVPLKTITKKDKSNKDKNINHKTQQQQEVVVVQKGIMDLFDKRISRKNVESLILLAEQENADLCATIQNTYEYHTKVQACRNVFGAIKYALENGAWDIPDTTDHHVSRTNPVLLQIQKAPQRKYVALPIETLRSIYGLA